jgi:DnaA family protein
MSAQLPLALPVGPDQRFDLFVGHDWAVDALRAAAQGCGEGALYVEGGEGSGKTHLLLAACRAAQECGRRSRYLPLAAFAGALDSMLLGLEAEEMLALDGLEAVAASRADCEALFHLHNRLRDAGRTVIYASRLPTADAVWALPDLQSRLGQCLRVTLEPLDDVGRREALRRRAARRGLELDDAVLDWLFRRVDRDLRSMTSLLDTLDRAAMAAQRRLTVPFVRQVLEQS